MTLFFSAIQQWHIQDQFDCLMTLSNILVLEAVVFVMYAVVAYFICYSIFFLLILSRMLIFNLFILLAETESW